MQKKQLNTEDTEGKEQISFKEGMILAKDVFDLRTAIKRAYQNRELIRRRFLTVRYIVSILMLSVYAVFAFVSLWSRFTDVIPYEFIIALTAVYVVVFLTELILTARLRSADRLTEQKKRRTKNWLRVFRSVFRLANLTMAISVLVIIFGNGFSSVSVPYVVAAVSLVAVSIVSIVFEFVPVVINLAYRLIVWMISPEITKAPPKKYREWLHEWLEAERLREKTKNPVKMVKNKLKMRKIERWIDEEIIPKLGDVALRDLNGDVIGAFVSTLEKEHDREQIRLLIEQTVEDAIRMGYVKQSANEPEEEAIPEKKPAGIFGWFKKSKKPE